MSYLIDTCAWSEFTRSRPAAAVDRWFAATPESACFASVLTLGELAKGIEKLPAGSRRRDLGRWLAALRARLEGRTLDVTAAVALEWGRISARAERDGRPLPVVDTLIGATAIVHGLTVVTRNASHVGRTGARILDPWAGDPGV